MTLTRVPVTVITGYLGSGKTTLINRILTEEHGQRIAVIENEFGALNIDHALLKLHVEEEIYEMNNGCICCNVRGDLLRAMERLLKRRDKFDRIVIETTGLATPGPVAQTFFVDSDLAEKTVLDAVVTVVDAKHVLQHVYDAPECAEQIGFADVLVLNKQDLLTPEALAHVTQALRPFNPVASILPCSHGNVALEAVLQVGGFDLERAVTKHQSFLGHASTHTPHHPHAHPTHEDASHDDGHHHHDHDHGGELPHFHDHSVTSQSFQLKGWFDMPAFQTWLSALTKTHGENLFRCKGIVALDGLDKPVIFQGVHMLLDMVQAETPWEQRTIPESQFVFIGRDLPAMALEAGLHACLRRQVQQV